MKKIITIASLLSLASLTSACDDRYYGPRSCPEDELCSAKTPLGLFVEAGPLGDGFQADKRHGTVIGGKQTVRVFEAEDHTKAFTGFDAQSVDPSFKVLEKKDNVVTIEGVKGPGGRHWLFLVDPDSGELFDFIFGLGSGGTVDRIAVVPSQSEVLDDTKLNGKAAPEVVFHTLAANETRDIHVALLNADGKRVVDESMQIALPEGFAVKSGAWDGIEQKTVAAGTYDVSVTLGSGERVTTSVEIVDSIDAVSIASVAKGIKDGKLKVGQKARACFRPENKKRAVIGAGLISIAASPELLGMSEAKGNCVTVEALKEGAATLTVAAGSAPGLSLPIAITK